MYARVARFEGGTADGIRSMIRDVEGRSEQGPPPGVPAKGVMFLTDPDNGRVLAITLFETEDDLRTGDAVLNDMSPGSEEMGSRGSVETYEVAFEARQ